MSALRPPKVGLICHFCSPTQSVLSRSQLRQKVTTASPSAVWRSIPSAKAPRRWQSTLVESAPNTSSTTVVHTDQQQQQQQQQQSQALDVQDPSELARIVEDSLRKFTAVDGIPTKQLTATALRSCLRAAATLHPQLKRAEAQSRASASRLASLGAERTGVKLPVDSQIQDAVQRISYAAYTILSQPNVEMRPEYLEVYVHIQHQLGRPESLPAVLNLYANKAKPVVRDGQIHYVPSKPNAPEKAIESAVAETALQTAIDARNLDAALGIIEAAYTVPAFRRQKLIKHGTVPAMAVASLPFGIVGLSTAYAAYWQNTMDMTTATGIGAAGISGYFLVVGSLGLIAKLSAKEQMRRVTWTPGTPLRYRWLREDERAALDKVACAWGFKETWRHGEEMGPEWEGLKEYMGYRGMLLDRVEFMEGMS